tara:strand:- start:1316 stop:2278 length:963 start_codon:yes stop_codon:yes gene_type:complete
MSRRGVFFGRSHGGATYLIMALERIAVIGAGASGLACAARLKQLTRDVVVFEKSRDIGGRLAARRAQGWRWNHGAPRADGMRTQCQSLAHHLVSNGSAYWARDALVGMPDMREILRPLAVDMTVELGCAVDRVELVGGGEVTVAERAFDRVVVAVPAPQAIQILQRSEIAVPAALHGVAMLPRWTLILGLAAPCTSIGAISDHVVASATLQSNPMQREGQAWVVQATDRWSQAHVELPKSVAAERLIDHLWQRSEAPLPPMIHCVAHRWRYAQTQRPLGEPSVSCADRRVSLCGDWCLGPTAADACRSGTILAKAIAADA